LPDIDPQVFQDYLSWIYSGRLDLSTGVHEDSGSRDRLVVRYLELYLVGDALDDLLLRNKVIRLLVMDTSVLPRPSIVERVWKKTPESSPIRKVLVDRATIRTKRDFLTSNLVHFPRGFVLQVAVSLLQEVPAKGKELLEAKLPSYLEPVEPVD
jgi:hypothetical protein